MAAGPARPALPGPGALANSQQLLAAATALTNATTQPAIQQLQGQIGTNNAQTQQALRQIGGYFNSVGQQAAGNVGAEQNIFGDFNNPSAQPNSLAAQLGANAQNTQSELKGIGDTAQSQLLKYAPQDDPQNSLARAALQSLTAESARQQGLAAQQAGNWNAFGRSMGANYQGLASLGGDVIGRAGQQELSSVANAGQLRNEPLTSKLATLIANRPNLLQTNYGRLRQQEIANGISEAGLGIRQASLNNTIRNDNARNQLTARGQNITLSHDQQLAMQADRTYRLNVQKFGAAQAKDAYLRAHGLGPYKPARSAAGATLTPTGQRALAPQQQQVRFAQVDALRQLIRDAQQPLSPKDATALGMQPGQKLSEAQIRGLLADGRNPAKTRFDPALIDTAYALNGYGFVTPKQIAELNKLGLIVGNRYKRGNAPAAPKLTNPPDNTIFGGQQLGSVF